MEKVDPQAPRPLAREADLVVQRFPDEVMVYDLRNHKAHCLNQTAAFVWRHCDGQRAVAELAALLTQEAGSPVGEEVVWYALDKLNKADLLQERIAVPVADNMSRRRMVKRVGALVVLPAVISL
ncbi:MAG TPA: PqqD family protein, partial [Blastocatellia bacterium]|nr:PqqD family protein [Blastocatellia bacterium]